MFPYQIYQALSDQRIRDLMAEARRHEMVTAARNARMELKEPSSRRWGAVAKMGAMLHFRARAHASSTMNSVSGAGPMGCSA